MKPLVPEENPVFTDKTASQRVLEVLYLCPDKDFSLSELAKEAHIAKSNISPILRKLEKAGIIEITRLSTIWRIRAKMDSDAFRKLKMARNFEVLLQSGLVEAIEELYNNPPAIILFGSFRNGLDISTSDIDIAVESWESGEFSTESPGKLAGFERKLKRKIQIHVFNRENVDANVFSNIANGIVLSGFLEARL